jgi:predicted nuclease of predicted toxin-antitoxin system
VKLLLDENLSPRLVSRLAELFGEIVHVREVGLREADDRAIWDWAKSNGHLVVTADGDFVALSQHLGFPPKVVHLEQCEFPYAVIESLLRRNAVRIAEFDKDPTAGVLPIRLLPIGEIS